MGFFKQVDALWAEGKTPAEIARLLKVDTTPLMSSFVSSGYLRVCLARNAHERLLWGSPVVYQDENGRIFLPDGRMPGER
jgi:hypothetical protein